MNCGTCPRRLDLTPWHDAIGRGRHLSRRRLSRNWTPASNLCDGKGDGQLRARIWKPFGIGAMNHGLWTRWVIEAAFEAAFPGDAERLVRSLAQRASEQSTFGYTHTDGATTAVVMGTDEADLDAHLAALRRIHGSELRIATPQVRYRSAAACAADVDQTHK